MALSEKGIQSVKNIIQKKGGNREAALYLVDLFIGKLAMGLSTADLPDTSTLMNGLDTIEDFLGSGEYDLAVSTAKETANDMLDEEGFPGMFENKKTIKKNKKMKQVTFKKKFTNINEVLNKVPKVLREDKNVFKMTDGNKTYQMRWEGTSEKGKAVVLQANDKSLMNEDVQRMKHLWGYKSENTLGKVTSENRVDENKTFNVLMNKLKSETKKKKG